MVNSLGFTMSETEAGDIYLLSFFSLLLGATSGTFIMGTPSLMYTMYPFLLWRKGTVENQLI